MVPTYRFHVPHLWMTVYVVESYWWLTCTFLSCVCVRASVCVYACEGGGWPEFHCYYRLSVQACCCLRYQHA